jgi:hypothetical protein
MIKKFKELVATIKSILEIAQAIRDIKVQCKDEVLGLAKEIDGIIAKYQASPSTADDKLIPLLQIISDKLKGLVA